MKPLALPILCALLAACGDSDPQASKERQEARATAATERAEREAHERFRELEFDGRWGWYRRAVQEPAEEAQWAAWLAERGSGRFLEWLALCSPRRFALYGGALRETDDPRWPRVAAWTLDSTEAVDASAARAMLEDAPEITRAWLEAHADALAPTEQRLLEELRGSEAPPADVSDLLPPLAASKVYHGLLREARDVREGGATAAPDEQHPERADAGRAIEALRLSGRRPTLVLDALADVARHPDATLVMAVARTAMHLEPDEIPFASLLDAARDEERPMALREVALDAVAAGPRYAAYIELCKLVLQPRSDLWPAAARHLGRIGDRFAAQCLSELGDDELDADRRTLRDQALAAIDARRAQEGPNVRTLLERITYADLAGGSIRDKALETLADELCDHANDYESKYRVKEIMVLYEEPDRLPGGLDPTVWVERLREHGMDVIDC